MRVKFLVNLRAPEPEIGTQINNGAPGVLRNPKVYSYAWNSIHLSLWTSFFTALLGVILGYAIVKGRGTRLARLVEQLAFIPYVIPGIAFGAVYISMFARRIGPIPPPRSWPRRCGP
mgnify:CR=1 FL=1